MKKLDLLVVIDPYPSATAAMAAMVRKDGVYLLPAATQLETLGLGDGIESLPAMARESDHPLFESRTDHMIMYRVRQEIRLRSPSSSRTTRWSSRTARAEWEEPEPSRSCVRSTGAAGRLATPGQSPERLQAAHEEHGTVRRQNAARQRRRSVRRRLLRLAMAMLWHAGNQAPRIAQSVRHSRAA